MPRDFGTDANAQLRSSNVCMAPLLEMEFTSDIVRVWPGTFELTTHDSKIWQGAGKLARVSAVEDSAVLENRNFTFGLSLKEVAQGHIDYSVLEENITGQIANLYLQYFEPQNWAKIGNPQLFRRFFMSYAGLDLSNSDDAFIYIECEDYYASRKKPSFGWMTDANQKDRAKHHYAPSDKIKHLVLIPGTGEFVYSTAITSKTPSGGSAQTINENTPEGKADVLVALDQMLENYPNLQSVALVASWFGASLDAGSCTIEPKTEDDVVSTGYSPTGWQVGSLTRSTANKVNNFADGSLAFGGTPSDHTIVQICAELKSRGLEVLFYPFLLLDQVTTPAKPWRGNITPANASDAASFFTQTNGYNDFIEHYANLLVGKIDAFLIGSEMVGMTTFSDSAGSFPAVSQLKTLAASVKTILGSGIKLGYAADWSEYHSYSGWFHLDPLWSDNNIDFVGIDAYFPITPDLPQYQITSEKIKEYWEKGEGWDYYYSDSVNRTGKENYSGSAYAWKNIEYWWKNTHTNPDTNVTGWTAKMKPIWFTELGCASVDGAANQSNIFYDPTSNGSGFPRESNGFVSEKAQRDYINASLDFWNAKNAVAGDEALVERIYIYTFDARPYPYFPEFIDIWTDGDNWKYGHWINGKLLPTTDKGLNFIPNLKQATIKWP